MQPNFLNSLPIKNYSLGCFMEASWQLQRKKPLVATQKLNRKVLKHKRQKTTKQNTQEEKKKRN